MIWSSNPTPSYLPKRNENIYTKTCTWMLITTLVIVQRNRRQPRRPSAGERTDRSASIQWGAHRSAVSRSRLLIHTTRFHLLHARDVVWHVALSSEFPMNTLLDLLLRFWGDSSSLRWRNYFISSSTRRQSGRPSCGVTRYGRPVPGYISSLRICKMMIF